MEGAALSNAPRKRRDGAVDSVVIREEAGEAGGPPKVRAATREEETKTSTLEYLKQWMGWCRSVWFHSLDDRTLDQPVGGVLWPEGGGQCCTDTARRGTGMRRLTPFRTVSKNSETVCGT